MDYYSVISRFDPQRHEFYRYEFRWPARLHHTIRVLLVAHGAAEPDLARVVDALTTDLPYHVNVEVTTARHASGGAGPAGFRFTDHDLAAYDQVWLIATGPSAAYRPGEAAAIWDFMRGGGGVFASGAGAAAFGLVPRVRAMRHWAPTAPDTPGPAFVRPAMYPVGWPALGHRRSAPHPVLCGRDGPITVLPDHGWDGQVVDPARIDLTATATVDGALVEEFPRGLLGRVSPEIVATGNHQSDGAECNLVSTYDGHLVTAVDGGVGRIVVDATAYHLFAAGVEHLAGAHDAVRTAIAAGGTPTTEQVALADHWRQVMDYFQNVAIWLARTGSQDRVRRLGLLLAANHVDTLMAWQPRPVEGAEQRLPYLRDLGARALNALHRFAPLRQRVDVTSGLLRRLRLEELTRPWRLRLFDYALVEQVALGGAVDALHRAVSDRDYADLPGERFDRLTRCGADAALEDLIVELRVGVETLAGMLDPDGPHVVHSGQRVSC